MIAVCPSCHRSSPWPNRTRERFVRCPICWDKFQLTEDVEMSAEAASAPPRPALPTVTAQPRSGGVEARQPQSTGSRPGGQVVLRSCPECRSRLEEGERDCPECGTNYLRGRRTDPELEEAVSSLKESAAQFALDKGIVGGVVVIAVAVVWFRWGYGGRRFYPYPLALAAFGAYGVVRGFVLGNICGRPKGRGTH